MALDNTILKVARKHYAMKEISLIDAYNNLLDKALSSLRNKSYVKGLIVSASRLLTKIQASGVDVTGSFGDLKNAFENVKVYLRTESTLSPNKKADLTYRILLGLKSAKLKP